MSQWMDADTIEALTPCWADFSLASMVDASTASVALFDKVSNRTASAIGIAAFVASPVRAEINRLTDQVDG